MQKICYKLKVLGENFGSWAYSRKTLVRLSSFVSIIILYYNHTFSKKNLTQLNAPLITRPSFSFAVWKALVKLSFDKKVFDS